MANKTDLIGGLDRSSCVVDAELAERVCASLGKFVIGVAAIGFRIVV